MAEIPLKDLETQAEKKPVSPFIELMVAAAHAREGLSWAQGRFEGLNRDADAEHISHYLNELTAAWENCMQYVGDGGKFPSDEPRGKALIIRRTTDWKYYTRSDDWSSDILDAKQWEGEQDLMDNSEKIIHLLANGKIECLPFIEALTQKISCRS